MLTCFAAAILQTTPLAWPTSWSLWSSSGNNSSHLMVLHGTKQVLLAHKHKLSWRVEVHGLHSQVAPNTVLSGKNTQKCDVPYWWSQPRELYQEEPFRLLWSSGRCHPNGAFTFAALLHTPLPNWTSNASLAANLCWESFRTTRSDMVSQLLFSKDSIHHP